MSDQHSDELPRSHRKHKHEEHHEEHHEGEGPWIVSYADMMTLLFCFFVIMTSFANFDPVIVAGKSGEVAKYFSPEKENDKKKIIESLANELGGHPNLKGIAKTFVKDNTLEIVFSSTFLFPAGEARLTEKFEKNIDIVVGLIKNKDPNFRIIVEGHTDSSPLSEMHDYTSNWALSGARSAAVAERFVYYKYNSANIASVAFGNSRPIAPEVDKNGNEIAENKALNRRVIIKVLQPLQLTKNAPIKNGSYIEDYEILKK